MSALPAQSTGLLNQATPPQVTAVSLRTCTSSNRANKTTVTNTLCQQGRTGCWPSSCGCSRGAPPHVMPCVPCCPRSGGHLAWLPLCFLSGPPAGNPSCTGASPRCPPHTHLAWVHLLFTSLWVVLQELGVAPHDSVWLGDAMVLPPVLAVAYKPARHMRSRLLRCTPGWVRPLAASSGPHIDCAEHTTSLAEEVWSDPGTVSLGLL